jgi:hypothetical protein
VRLEPYVIEVVFDDGWKIDFEGKRFGPYSGKTQAVATASEWVENGRKQGHQVTLSIRGRPSGPEAIEGRRAPSGGRAA